MADLWLTQFIKKVWDIYGLGYACAYLNPSTPWPMDPKPAGLAHSTETTVLPGYNGGSYNPNFTVDPWRKQRWQHVPANITARALMDHNEAVVQIEIIGYCDPARKDSGYYLPLLDDAGRDYLAQSLQIIGDALGIPPVTTVTWKPYPASGGVNNGIRLDATAFHSYTGWLGHQHAPAPDFHGDPGDIMPDIVQRMAKIVAGRVTATPQQPKPAPKPAEPTVQQGSTGAAVKTLQAAINTWCQRHGWKTRLATDGIFGPRTDAVVRAFQRGAHLVVDGIVGPHTWAALDTYR